MRYGSGTEIVSQILEIANGSGSEGETETKTIYKTFLNYGLLKDYLKTLIDQDLIRYDGETYTFKTTEKGLLFLEAYNHIAPSAEGTTNLDADLIEKQVNGRRRPRAIS
jgi:predicted transcriptional regulator